nr:hypothetical protein [Gemmatimonadota bacterium]
MISRTRPLGIFFIVVASCSYFQNEPGGNGTSRMDLVRALVEDGGTRIDRFHENTSDKSFAGGHYYSDKAPGSSFLAVPAYAARFAILQARHGRESARRMALDAGSKLGLPLCTLLAVVLPWALAVTLFAGLAERLAGAARPALFAAASLGLGSLGFPYATVYFGHSLCAALLFLSFGLLLRERLRSGLGNGAPRTSESELRAGRGRDRAAWRPVNVAAAGFAAGYAVVTEFPAAVPAAPIGAYLLWNVRSLRGVAPFALAGLVPAIPLAIYNEVSFGSPWKIGYASLAEPYFVEMGQGFLGLTYPRPAVLLEILFGVYRGLLPLSPVFLLVPAGALRM